MLDSELSRIDALIAEANRSILLLRERLAALVSAAVTGKIDVRRSAKGYVA
jgi:type I restriction enzyme S subunit